MSKRLLALLLGVLLVAIAGCGGSDDGGDTTAAALGKAEFIKKADAICTKGNEAIEDEADDFAKEKGIDTSNASRAEQEEAISEVVAPGIRRQAEEIAALGAPSGDEDQVEAMIAAVEDGADKLSSDPGLLLGNKSPLAEATKLASAYGLEVCGQG